MHKLQQLFDRFLGLPPVPSGIALSSAEGLHQEQFARDHQRFAELATPACWRRRPTTSCARRTACF